MRGLHYVGQALYYDDTLISDATGATGLYVDAGRALYFNGEKIADGDAANPIGLVAADGVLYFDGAPVGVGEVVEPSEFSAEGYWIPPEQPANEAGKNLTYAQILALYDTLAAGEPRLTKHRYEVGGSPVITANGSYELFHYKYEPPAYDKTIFMQAAIHGSEKDSRLTLYRMIEIMLTLRDTTGYRAWQQVYDRCRLIIIPVVSPYGNDQPAFNLPYKAEPFGLNPNRNFDFNHQTPTTSGGTGGDVPFDVAETRHTRDVINFYGAHTVDLAIDYHDGESSPQHYWISYSVDAPNRPLVNAFVDYLLAKHGVAPGDAIIPNVSDNSIPGSTGSWLATTMGITGSTNEWLGGIWGYDFGSAHLTHSLEVRSNLLFIALANDIKGWRVNEPEGASYFHFDYPRGFTRNTLRQEGAGAETKVSDASIYARWDALQAANPSLIAKSGVLGVNATGLNVHTYTFGSGATKVLYVGGVMRYGGMHKIDEYAIYQLVEYLCNPAIVAQSAFLTDLRNNYALVVLPFIDNAASNNNDPERAAGLNNTVLSKQRWVIDGGTNKTIPAAGIHGAGNHAVAIVKTLVDANPTLKCIVSGGEIMTGYSLNPPDYATTGFHTHIVTPRNMPFNRAAYAAHLTANRGETVLAQNTQGFTFGDYAYDQLGIPTYFVQLLVSPRYAALADDHTLTVTDYLHSNYEAGRRMANIVNLFLA